MKKIFVALMALAAVAPLAAGTLADFSEGMGRVTTSASPKNFVERAEIGIVDDADAPTGKALRAKLSDKKEGVKFARYDVIVRLKPEEAAKIREIAFDVRMSDRKAFGWTVIYFFKKSRTVDCLKRVIANKAFKIGEWQHFSFPIDSLGKEGQGIEMSEAGQFVITFFTYGPLEISVANITCAE